MCKQIRDVLYKFSLATHTIFMPQNTCATLLSHKHPIPCDHALRVKLGSLFGSLSRHASSAPWNLMAKLDLTLFCANPALTNLAHVLVNTNSLMLSSALSNTVSSKVSGMP